MQIHWAATLCAEASLGPSPSLTPSPCSVTQCVVTQASMMLHHPGIECSSQCEGGTRVLLLRLQQWRLAGWVAWADSTVAEWVAAEGGFNGCWLVPIPKPSRSGGCKSVFGRIAGRVALSPLPPGCGGLPLHVFTTQPHQLQLAQPLVINTLQSAQPYSRLCRT